MQVEITIKNYRCFSDSKPAHIILRKGFTAFVGVNNSGKSSLLKFFYEFRSFFQLLSSSTNENFIAALRGKPQSFNFATSVLDIEEVFNNTNHRNLEIQIRFLDVDLITERNAPPIVDKIVITIPRLTNTSLAKLFVKNKKWEWKIDDDNPDFYRIAVIDKDNIYLSYEDTPEVNLYPLFKTSKDISEALYIGPFRNALELVTNTDYHSELLTFGDYFDIKIGRAFIRNWRTFKSGKLRKNSEAAYRLTEDIRRIFGFKSLEINTSDDNRTLQLFINGKSYTLLELGSGLAQFILVLANAAIKQPSYILIDEPELNLHPSLQLVMGNKYKALEPYEALKKKAQNGWDKADNWRIAQEMTREELEGTDLGEFLKRLCD